MRFPTHLILELWRSADFSVLIRPNFTEAGFQTAHKRRRAPKFLEVVVKIRFQPVCSVLFVDVPKANSGTTWDSASGQAVRDYSARIEADIH